MRVGFSLLFWTVAVRPEHAPLFARLGALGYDGVEVPVGAPGDYAAVRRWADDAGLACTACGLVGADADPSSPDAAVRARALDALRACVERAAELGSDVLVGPLYAAHKAFRQPPPGDDARRRAAEVLHGACEHAAGAGVRLALEPLNRFEVQLVNTVDEALRVVELCGHERLGVLYDTHHGHIEEASHEDALARCGARLVHVQLSESHRGTLGGGQVDFAAVKRGLDRAGYDGWLVAEAFGTGVELLSAAACVHRDCFESRDQLVRDALGFLRAFAS